MYFGTRDKMLWVPCPAVDRPASNVGWGDSMAYLNGGAYVRRSKGSHRTFEMAWNMISAEDAGRIEALAGGAYGEGPYFWVDPMASEHNVLPDAWAFPGSAAYRDGVNTAVTPANDLDYPVRSALFNAGQRVPRPIWIPVPPGHTAHVGVHGTGTSGVFVTRDVGTNNLATMLPVTSTQRTNTTVAGGAAGNGFTLHINPGNATYAGIIVQILPTGRTVLPGGWLNGLGTSGSEFSEHPERTDYSSVMDKVGLTATLTEVGTWL